MRDKVENEIREKRPCNKFGAKNEDECVVKQCGECEQDECCNNCCCCDDGGHDVTPSEWKAYFSNMGMDLPPDYLANYVPPLRKL